jgi:heparan-alpha-glucosaminide N-acetyltransferase
MFLMLAEVLHLSKVAKALPASNPDKPIWDFFAGQQTHVEWAGCTLHDLIQPSFSFLVGLALPFSLLARSARGQKFILSAFHALWRAVLLVFLGVFLRSTYETQTNYTFEDTLSQIGLGYFFLFLLGYARPRWQWIALGTILVGYWIAFAVYAPDSHLGEDMTSAKPGWPYGTDSFAAHWNKNANPAAAFDRWFLNLFPRKETFKNNSGGYATLSFIPTLGTMILGLIAGGWLLRSDSSSAQKFLRLAVAGIVLLGAGFALDWLGVCPSVKRIWTPSWVLFSGGWCFLILAGFYATTDWIGFSGWAYPLRVIGANSIAAYIMAHLIREYVVKTCQIHFGANVFKQWGTVYEPFAAGLAVLAVYWLILFWMYQRRIFLRI